MIYFIIYIWLLFTIPFITIPATILYIFLAAILNNR